MEDRKNNIIKAIIIVVVIVLICALCFFASESANSNVSSSNHSSEVSDITSQAQSESSAIKDSEKKDFNDINVDYFVERYNSSKKSIVLLSRPTCSYCQIAEPILHHIAYTYDLEVNHLNTDDFSDDDFSKLTNTNERFESFGTPLLVIVSNGEIVDEVSGLTTTKVYTEFFRKYGFINK